VRLLRHTTRLPELTRPFPIFSHKLIIVARVNNCDFSSKCSPASTNIGGVLSMGALWEMRQHTNPTQVLDPFPFPVWSEHLAAIGGGYR